jgi:hypothetical protein
MRWPPLASSTDPTVSRKGSQPAGTAAAGRPGERRLGERAGLKITRFRPNFLLAWLRLLAVLPAALLLVPAPALGSPVLSAPGTAGPAEAALKNEPPPAPGSSAAQDPASGKEAAAGLSGSWAWWSLVRPEDSPFGPYDFQREKLFRLEVSSETAPAVKPDVRIVRVLARVTPVNLQAHRQVSSGRAQTVSLEPVLRDGRRYVRFRADRIVFVEISAQVLAGSTEILAQTQASLYPPYLASVFPSEFPAGGRIVPEAELSDLPRLALSGRGPKTALFRAKVPLKLSLSPPGPGRLLELAQGSAREIAGGHLEDLMYFPPEDRRTDALGLGYTQTAVLLADLEDRGRLSLSLEVFRHNLSHSSKPQGAALLGLTVLLSGLGIWYQRLRQAKDHRAEPA